MPGHALNLKGKKIGKLTGIRRLELEKAGYLWLLRCDCGRDVLKIASDVVKEGADASCHKGGCRKKWTKRVLA